MRGSLSILSTSQQAPTLQIKSNAAFGESIQYLSEFISIYQYLSEFMQSTVSSELTLSQLWVSFCSSSCQDFKAYIQGISWFFISGGLNWESALTGAGMHKGAQFSSLLIKLQFHIANTHFPIWHFQLSVACSCTGNHKNIQNPTLAALTDSQNTDLCLQYIFAGCSSLQDDVYEEIKFHGEIKLLSCHGRGPAPVTQHHPVIQAGSSFIVTPSRNSLKASSG